MEATSHISKGKTPVKSRPKRVEKCADPDLQGDVDEMILDYLIHNAIESSLKQQDIKFTDGKQRDEAELHMNMVECTYIMSSPAFIRSST